MTTHPTTRSRRFLLKGLAATGGAAAAASFVPARFAIGQQAKIKLGLMLPYSGTYALLGKNIDEAFRLYINEHGGKLGGRDIEWAQVDDESDPPKGADNANKLITREKVDFLIGTVHSGVEMAMLKVARDNETFMIIPNAGLKEATGALCAPYIFRTSFTNWQPGFAMGTVAAKRGWKKAVTITWAYAAGAESTGGFKDAFTKGGGSIVKEMSVPFPQVEFQALLTEIASIKPDVVYAFYAGGGAAKFVKDYVAAGLRTNIPLVGPGFLTDGVLEAQGDAAKGLETALHYADGLDNAADKHFRPAFQKAANRVPDVYAVQGYDTAALLVAGVNAVKGDIKARKEMIAAMEKTEIDSPRGKFRLSKSHNPVQDMYLRKVEGLENKVAGIAVKALADPDAGCSMA